VKKRSQPQHEVTGHPLDEQTGLGPVISEHEAIRVEQTIRDAVDAGATRWGGSRTAWKA